MHVQPPLAEGEQHGHGGRPPAWPDPSRGSGISMLKAIARAQRDCAHAGGVSVADPYSDRDQCVLCDREGRQRRADGRRPPEREREVGERADRP